MERRAEIEGDGDLLRQPTGAEYYGCRLTLCAVRRGGQRVGEHRRDERQRGDEAEVARADGDERASLQRRPRERPLGRTGSASPRPVPQTASASSGRVQPPRGKRASAASPSATSRVPARTQTSSRGGRIGRETRLQSGRALTTAAPRIGE